ncbi:cation transporter [Oleomonas cavernae]|uniref:Cation transporter n=1 Tax=Oleomonas cavernae TaxID=2320859 RepID=A0A418WE75_9PROT|nr:cation diffusion facilitator family transporter [Oleomonas cavernae]RJF88286.1 cation transporter [Oleomonas cavernae]
MADGHHDHAHHGHDHHDHDHGHDHHDHSHGGHGHSHAPADFGRAFAIGISLNLGFVIVEAAYGLIAGSLALVADAGHNLSDVLGLVIAWIAATLARRRPSARRTYGMKRSSILASLTNAVLLLIAVGAIVFEAVRRLDNPAPVAETTVIVVAAIGIAINLGTALLFARGRKGDINIRGAYLHMAADAAVSLGVVVAGFAMMATGWLWLDPLVSLGIALVIVLGTWGLLRESIDLALDAVPAGIDEQAVKAHLAALPGVTAVHDLHIWAMSTTETALTAHLVRPGHAVDDLFLGKVADELHGRFRIGHVTIQIEAGNGDPCRLEPAEVV